MKRICLKKPEAIVWRQFTRHRDAAFLSIGKEIRIGILSVATLAAVCPGSASAEMATGHRTTADEPAVEAAAFSDDPLDLSVLQNGDLLFNVASATSDDVTQAIVSTTEGIDLQRVFHVAIVCRTSDGVLSVLEASPRHGVWLQSLTSFIASCDHSADGHPRLLLGRLKDPSTADASVERARQYVGRPYDFQYLPGDSAIYCSELVQLSYLDSSGNAVFPQEPMSFHDTTGTILPFWKDYYRQWNMDVPEGLPGTNPGGISRSDRIEIIGKFFPTNGYELTLGAIEVVGTLAPLPSDKAVRLVRVITREEIEASSANSVNDLLKLAAGVDVRQRGGFGIQTDIGINGGTEDQLTVLLNGVNISSPHTGHLTADLPVSVDDIERIEVIEGGASRVYGSQAFSGAVNIVTRTDRASEAGAMLQGGSYGTLQAGGHLSFLRGGFNNRVSGGYSRSDGGTVNDDFEKGNAYWNGRYSSDRLDASLQAGFSTMSYGANTFYGTGSNSQHETDSRLLLALQGEYKGKVHVLPRLYWHRSLDHYEWLRANPAAYQNFHQTNVYGASVNAHTSWALGKTAVGLELRREDILSTRLGKEIAESKQHHYKVPGRNQYYGYKDGRTNLGLYMEHDILLRQATLSIGALATHNTAVEGGMRLYPGIDFSWRAAEGLKLFASFNQSLRTPTFTDLYYNGPGLQGNTALKPEKSTNWNVGVSYAGRGIDTHLKGYYIHGTDMIDWVKYAGEAVYTTANSDIDCVGTEALVSLNLNELLGEKSLLRRFTLSYCYNYKHRRNEEQASQYASRMTFLRHKLVASLNHRIAGPLSAQWDVTLKNRAGTFDNARTGQPQPYGTFATLDLKLTWTRPSYTLFVQGTNLTDHAYFDHANVEQPGIWVMAGAKMRIPIP